MKLAILTSVVVALTFGIYGCGTGAKPAPSATAGTPAAADTHADHSHDGHAAGHDAQAGQSDMEKMMATLASFSPEDRASVMKQHVCPVSGEMLGVMSPPLKVDVNGQQVWICCPDCKQELLDHPDQYLAKLKSQSN